MIATCYATNGKQANIWQLLYLFHEWPQYITTQDQTLYQLLLHVLHLAIM